jgi:hypothetical protein
LISTVQRREISPIHILRSFQRFGNISKLKPLIATRKSLKNIEKLKRFYMLLEEQLKKPRGMGLISCRRFYLEFIYRSISFNTNGDS